MKICTEISENGEVRVTCEGNDKLCNALRLVLNLMFNTLASIEALVHTMKTNESESTSTSRSQ